MKKSITLILTMLLFVGCNEAQQVPANVKPLNSHLLPTPQNWIDAYGDTLQIQLVYNAAAGMNDDRILQNAILQAAQVIKNTHAADPNEIRWRKSVEERLGCLEERADKAIYEYDPTEGHIRWNKKEGYYNKGHWELYDGKCWIKIDD